MIFNVFLFTSFYLLQDDKKIHGSFFIENNCPGPKRKGSSSNHPFSGANLLLVSGRVIWESNFMQVLHPQVLVLPIVFMGLVFC